MDGDGRRNHEVPARRLIIGGAATKKAAEAASFDAFQRKNDGQADGVAALVP